MKISILPVFLLLLVGMPHANAEFVIGYDIQGPDLGSSEVLFNTSSTATPILFGGNEFEVEGFTVGTTAASLSLTPSDSNTNIFRFGFNAVGGTWTINEVDFATNSPSTAQHELSLRVSVNNGAFQPIGNFVSNDFVAEDFTGLSISNVSTALFEVVQTNSETAVLEIVGDGYAPSGADFAGHAGMNLGIAGSFTAVPEPTSLSLVAIGLGIGVLRSRRRVQG